MKHDLVTVERLYQEHSSSLQMKLLVGEAGLKSAILEPTVNRPGLALAGFTKYFAAKRVQVFGNAEVYYLKSLKAAKRRAVCADFFETRFPCAVFCRSFRPDSYFLAAAKTANVPVFGTSLITMKFINLATLAMEMMFAPSGTEIGSMVDILGVGVLIRGESGIGKSESVLTLIERGYSLVSDDVTKVTLVDGRDVMGTSSELTRNHIEVRGIGIVNIAAMFGVKSIRRDKRIDLVVTLKLWDEVEDVDRLGIDEAHVDILGVAIKHIVIPVRPGRDLARLIEVAAFQTKLKASGYNPAEELNARLIEKMTRTAKSSSERRSD